ncbi:hypothetical protein AZF00_16820 [Zhongshania aliphaticivorans]|uniref:Uncharacterized protein n=1 Tax=Zhongshania aliphaticivorans TaxID=1470434 RepID=A0A127M9D4_9GAMM|nr:hypothetical protein AZF00_16820 [Zhongshania aliphaticivorans]
MYTDNSTSNLTTQVTWASSNTNVATICNDEGSKGLAYAKLQFVATTTEITAFHANTNITGRTNLMVTAF